MPVLDEQGRIFGHVAIIDDKPMPEQQRAIDVMRIFAARVGAEVERLRHESGVRRGFCRGARVGVHRQGR